MKNRQIFIDKWFKDEAGEWAILQPANPPIIAVMLLTTLTVILLWVYSPASLVSGIATCIALAYWSWLELTSGVNYFRRLLGALGFIAVLLTIGWIILQ